MTRIPAARNLSLAGLACAAWLGLAVVPAAAQADGDAARRDTEEAIDTRQQTQTAQDGWADEKTALVNRFRAAQANVAWLTDRRADEQARTAALDARVAELERRLAEAVRLESSMQDTLQVIFGRLNESVEGSLPFLPTERRERLASLTRELVRPDVPAGEKLRRLLEALQVEAGYASTIEVYQDRITVGSEDLHADILRFGRVALFWRTPDGERVGTYDAAQKAWVTLPGSERQSIDLAMEMATRRRPVGITTLPLGRIVP